MRLHLAVHCRSSATWWWSLLFSRTDRARCDAPHHDTVARFDVRAFSDRREAPGYEPEVIGSKQIGTVDVRSVDQASAGARWSGDARRPRVVPAAHRSYSVRSGSLCCLVVTARCFRVWSPFRRRCAHHPACLNRCISTGYRHVPCPLRTPAIAIRCQRSFPVGVLRCNLDHRTKPSGRHPPYHTIALLSSTNRARWYTDMGARGPLTDGQILPQSHGVVGAAGAQASSSRQIRRISATDQAWATAPRGRCGRLPSKISEIEPRPASRR